MAKAFTTREQVFYFTERLSGSFQAGGSPEADSIFQVNPEMMENLFQLFLERPLPPEFEVGAEQKEPLANPSMASETSPENSPEADSE